MARREPARQQPIEESPQVASAVEDEGAAPQFAANGGPDGQTPEFREPGQVVADGPATDELIGDAYGAGWPGSDARTGAEQPWEPEDLAAAKGQDPTPENAAHARHELEADGSAAIERTVP